MSLIKKIIIGALIALAAMFLLGSIMKIVSPDRPDDREKLCKQWMEDSEPGSERRMTREMCERLGVKL